MPSPEIPLIVILGPTAVGKTEIAIQLAQRLNGEIVSADSRLFYRGMDIGTAKPSLAERAGVPHHLIDVADPDEVWSLALFQRRAQAAIGDIWQRGKLPFLVGGTGQYIKAIVEGWDIPAVKADPRLRAALELWGQAVGPLGLHARLASLDPAAAARIEPQNIRRTVRALEVIFHTGKRFSEQRKHRPSPYRTLNLGLTRPRPELYARADERLQAMLEAGFVAEVRRLLDAGYSPALPTLSAIGYQQIAAYLQGQISLAEAITQIKRLTRQFIRRQANWFKLDDPTIHWFTVSANTVDEMSAVIRTWMASHDGNTSA